MVLMRMGFPSRVIDVVATLWTFAHFVTLV